MTTEHKCSTCFYDLFGWDKSGKKVCLGIIGVCSGKNNLQGWKPIENPDDVIDTTPYLQEAQVMPEEKPYMSFEGVI